MMHSNGQTIIDKFLSVRNLFKKVSRRDTNQGQHVNLFSYVNLTPG